MERLSICVDVGSRNVINGMPQLLIFTKFQIARRRRVHANVKSNLFTPHIRVVVYFDYIHIEKRGKTNENSPNVINSPPVCSWWWYSLMMTTQQKLFLTTFYQLPLLHTHTLSLSITTICRNHAYLLTVSRLAAQKRTQRETSATFVSRARLFWFLSSSNHHHHHCLGTETHTHRTLLRFSSFFE